ncbi:MAG: NADH-quinone oxidoreductase subunit L [Phycisphaerae bacterium]
MMLTAPNLLLAATLLPLASFFLLIFFGKRMGWFSAAVATTAILLSFAASVAALIVWFGPMETPQAHRVQALAVPWLTFGNGIAPFDVGIMVDSLTLTMFVMITLVATLVHVFSIAYLAGDSRFSRFFAYLGLFCFSMLGLVLSNSLLQLFVFWELVGICSYLLIGFWFEKRGPALASKKAMVTNRIGDAGFLIGLGILVWQLGPGGLTLVHNDGEQWLTHQVRTVAQQQLAQPGNPLVAPGEKSEGGVAQFAAAAEGAESSVYLQRSFGPQFLGLSWLTWAGLGLCLGAVAKSAQFPLHVWLPDAMEGPTPVSALIHAATMVAAGVYLVARIFPILTLDARLFVAIIGCTTLCMGALIALVMTDIKKVLAYSTISQLGFMMLFLGCGGYVAGLFHLITHAFFKACLFLGSGSVIAGCHHEQEITKMGGLWRKMPVTALTFLLSVLAIAGTPGFSGYYSKDLGLAGVYEFAHELAVVNHTPAAMLLFWIPTVTAYLTAFYMARVWWLTFGGKPRVQEIFEHAKEHPLMTLPLIILGTLAVVAGYPFLKIEEIIRLSEPVRALAHTAEELLPNGEMGHGVHAVHNYLSLACVVGPVLAMVIYFRGLGIANWISRLPGVNLIYVWLKNKMFFDYLYEGVIVNLCKAAAFAAGWFDRTIVDGLVNLSGLLTRVVSWISGRVDSGIVDGLVNGAAALAQAGGRLVMRPETGRIRLYVLSMLTVVTLVLAGLVVAWTRWM